MSEKQNDNQSTHVYFHVKGSDAREPSCKLTRLPEVGRIVTIDQTHYKVVNHDWHFTESQEFFGGCVDLDLKYITVDLEPLG